jgi:hypothetical protein
MERKMSRKVIASAEDDQTAADNGPTPHHSLFTGVLIDGLRSGKVDQFGLGFVTSSQLGLYVQRVVSTQPNSHQTPVFGSFDLDQSGELLIRLNGDFQSLISQAETALANVELDKFRSLTDKVVALRPEAPEALYLQYRCALIDGRIPDALKFVGELNELFISRSVPADSIPLSFQDFVNVDAALRRWANVLSLPRLDSPLEYVAEYDPNQTSSGLIKPEITNPGVRVFSVREKTSFVLHLRNASPITYYTFAILIDGDGRISSLPLFGDDNTIGPKTSRDTTSVRAPRRSDEIHLFSSTTNLGQWLNINPSPKLNSWQQAPQSAVDLTTHTVLRIRATTAN